MNKGIIIYGILFLVFSIPDIYSQSNVEWVKYYHSINATMNEEANSLCIDDNSNSVVVGLQGINPSVKIFRYDTHGNVRLDLAYPGGTPNKVIFNGDSLFFISGSTGIHKLNYQGNITSVSNGNYTNVILGKDNYIYGALDSNHHKISTEKYELDGTLVWKRNYGLYYYTYNLYRIFQGVDNNIHVMGKYFYFSILPTNGPVYLTYDSTGNVLSNNGLPAGSAVEARNDFLNTNSFAGYSEQGIWHSNIVLHKVNANNNIVNTSYYSGTGNGRNEPFDVICDNSGNTYVACRSWGVAVDYDFVVLKYDTSGNLLWEYRFNGSENSYDAANKIKLDNAGNIVASGTITQNAHGIQIYTVKLSPSGELLWSDKFSRYNSVTDSNYVNDLQLDDNGNIYLCGKSRNSLTQRYDFMTLKYTNPTSSITAGTEIIKDFKLLDNYPNPFNPETNLKFILAKSASVKINIYNSAGEKITQLVNSYYSPGEHEIKWNAASFPSGVYFISFESGNFKEIKKAILSK
ncbi:MAG TPA: T9SS type A sorting domain-containing protein [Ignavibacteria bacterium]|nr:T9SS type A sorting domain-containing protein [Ignavibacteria bacterium]HMR39934.1 T9SS type A sorting domain-containing protein [Ignavibacteria bacterium]